MAWLAGAVAGLVLVAGGAYAWGTARWNGLTDSRVARLQGARAPIEPATVDFAQLHGLPAPVQRYLRRVLKDGAPRIAAVRIEHRGTFAMGARDADWKAFTSRQWVVVRRPGFVWDARVMMAPGLAVHVHDAYVAGEGILQAALLGLVDVADLRGDGEIASGELMRFLAEAAWYPTALLPGAGVTWEPIDDRRARATLVDGSVRIALAVSFTDDDLIAGVRADARGRTVGGRLEHAPWEGRFGDYEERDGLLVPTTGEVAWLLPSGRLPYWRGTTARLEYTFER